MDCPSTPAAPLFALTLLYASHTSRFGMLNGFPSGPDLPTRLLPEHRLVARANKPQMSRPLRSAPITGPGSGRESHPPAPTDPDVNLSIHPARAVQLSDQRRNLQCANNQGARLRGSPNLTGVPPGRLPPLEQPEPAGRYGARASARTLATVRDGRRVVPRRAWRAARVVAMRTRRVWLPGLANPRAFLATSFAVRLCASAFAFE